MTYAKLKTIPSTDVRFAFVFPKLLHKCAECKEEKHLILQCDKKLLEEGLADRQVYVIPIMNAVEYLQQHQILQKAEPSNFPCLAALSIGGSGIGKHQLR